MDKPEKSRELARKLQIPFPVLSDVDHKAIGDYDLYNGQENISKPATFLLDTKGIVRWSFFEEDYKLRPLTGVLVEALNRIK